MYKKCLISAFQRAWLQSGNAAVHKRTLLLSLPFSPNYTVLLQGYGTLAFKQMNSLCRTKKQYYLVNRVVDLATLKMSMT